MFISNHDTTIQACDKNPNKRILTHTATNNEKKTFDGHLEQMASGVVIAPLETLIRYKNQ